MKIQHLIAKVLASLIGGIAVYFLLNFLDSRNLPLYWAVSFSILLLIGIEYILVYLPVKFLWFRKLNEDYRISHYEGVWVQVTPPNSVRVISIATIKFDRHRRKHTYRGSAYDEKGNKKATWIADHLSHEKGDDVRAFTFTGKGKHLGGTLGGQKVRTVGYIDFDTYDHYTHPNDFVMGEGFYCDYDLADSASRKCEDRSNFKMHKLTKCDYIKYLGRPKMFNTLDDEKKLIVEYYKHNSDKLWPNNVSKQLCCRKRGAYTKNQHKNCKKKSI